MGFPCCARFPSCTCRRQYPGAATGRRLRSSHPAVSAFPEIAVGSACTSSFSRLARRSLGLRPAHSRRHLYVTRYTEGFSHFVTSMTAPVASGWSVRRVGLAPTGKAPPFTARANSGHSPMAQIDPGQKFESYARLGTALHRKCRGPGWVSAGPTEPKFGGAGTAEPSTWTTMLSDFARPHAQKGVAVI